MLRISKREETTDDPFKKHPLDFVLWVSAESKPNWESPWVMAVQVAYWCTAMIHEYLGEQKIFTAAAEILFFLTIEHALQEIYTM